MRSMSARRQRVALRHEGWAAGRIRLLDIRAGDTVEVVSGRDRGKRGVVERAIPAEQRIVVGGVNVLKRHTKAGVKGNVQGGVIDFSAPIAYSNVMLVCNRCDKRTRVGHAADESGSMMIACKRCGERYVRGAIS